MLTKPTGDKQETNLNNQLITTDQPLLLKAVWGLLGCGFLLLALFLPQAALVDWMASPLVSKQRVAEGISFLPFFFGLDGLVLLAVAFWPRRKVRAEAVAAEPLEIGLRDTARSEARAWQPWPQLALGLILVVATVLRFWNAGSDLWLDETGSLSAVRLPAHQLVATYQSPNQHFFYALLAHFSAVLGGESALTLRLPALLFGVGGVYALYLLGRTLTGELEALLASLFLAVSYHHIFFSQNARGYTQMVCLSLLASVVFLRAVERNKTGYWIVYALLSVFNIYTHMYGAFVTAGHLTAYALLLAVRRYPWSRTWPTTRKLLLTTAAIALISLQLYVIVFPQVFNYFTVTERKGIGFGYSNTDSFLSEVLRGLQLGFLGLAGLAIAGLICLVGLISYLRQSFFSMVALFSWMGYPVLSVVLLKMGVYPRFFLFALPVGFLLAVRGLRIIVQSLMSRVQSSRLGQPTSNRLLFTRNSQAIWVGLAVVGALITCVALGPLYSVPKQDFSGALAYAERVKQPGDKIVAVNMAGPVYQNFYRPGLTAAQDFEDLKALQQSGQTLWLIYIFPNDMAARFPELYDFVMHQSQPVKKFPGLIGDGEVYLNKMN